MSDQHRYFAIYKPFGVLSQFTKEAPDHISLKDTFPYLPKDVYPIGRLDRDSEGLLLLTSDNVLKNNVLNPIINIPKTYLAQVEGNITKEAIQKLKDGVEIRIKKKVHRTKKAQVELLVEAPSLPDRDPPVRYRASIPTSWIKITITEGKNRQIRRMCAKVGFPVLRLVRIGVGSMSLQGLLPGDVIEYSKKEMYRLINIPS